MQRLAVLISASVDGILTLTLSLMSTPLTFSKTVFPGQDYNNARIVDFRDVYDYASNQLSILESARMPWHDVCLLNPTLIDLATCHS